MLRQLNKNNYMMMEHNDELYLKQRVGNRNPFRVPEGYFEQLTEQVMQQLPAREQPIGQPFVHTSVSKAKKVQMRPWLYAAACSVLALALGVTLVIPEAEKSTATASLGTAYTPLLGTGEATSLMSAL